MEVTNKITKCLKNLRSTQTSPSLRIPQGVQAFTTVFLGLLTSFGVLALLSSIFFSNSAYAASYINVSSGSGGTVSLGSIKPSATGVSASGSDVLTIHTDCATGYSVYVSAQSDGDTNLTNTNKSITSNNVISASSTPVGSTATALSLNTWGINSENNNTYVGLPTFSEALSNALTTKSNVAEETTVPIYYGVKVDTSLSPGTYAGNVLYTVIMDTSCIPYTVIFGSNGGTGTMSNQSIMTGTPTNLTQNSFTRSGYIFLGWSINANGKTGTAVNGIGTSADVDYEDKAEVTNLTTGGTSITLYAIWEKEASYMQDFDIYDCLALSENEYLTLRDKRDNNDYVVKKLADGKCWMVENLRLVDYKLTSADSDVTDDFTLTASAGSNGWCVTDSSDCDNKSMAYYEDNRYSYGAIYNWYAATAGTGKYETSSGNASSSICPKGWRLPTSGSSGEFAYLDKALGGTGENRTGANTYSIFTGNYTDNNSGGFDLAGYIDGSAYNVSVYGIYWSSTAYNTSYAYSLNLYSGATRVYPKEGDDKFNGFSVRCIANDTRTISDISEMQEMNSSICSNSKIGENKVLTDTRDQETYRVNKLKDEECWMVENLRISDIELDSTTSDLATGTTFTVPKSTNEAFTASNAGTVAKMALSTDATNARAYGGYYNFVAATAGSGSGYNASTTSGTYSICPKGWTLPTKDQFVALDKAFGYSGENSRDASAQIQGSYLNMNYADGYPGFSLAGTYINIPNVTQRGDYWSSSVTSTTQAALLNIYVGGSELYPKGSTNKYIGESIRCIAR